MSLNEWEYVRRFGALSCSNRAMWKANEFSGSYVSVCDLAIKNVKKITYDCVDASKEQSA